MGEGAFRKKLLPGPKSTSVSSDVKPQAGLLNPPCDRLIKMTGWVEPRETPQHKVIMFGIAFREEKGTKKRGKP
jgi:hypothetical protein